MGIGWGVWIIPKLVGGPTSPMSIVSQKEVKKEDQILFITSHIKHTNKAHIIRAFKVSFRHFIVLIMRVIQYITDLYGTIFYGE